MFRFKCSVCDRWHEGMPGFSTPAPLLYDSIPQDQRAERCQLDSDVCFIDDRHYFVLGCLELPVIGAAEPFVWGVWVSLSKVDMKSFVDRFEEAERSHHAPFSGWLSARLPLYPDTNALRTRVHLRDHGMRPSIELEDSDHPLSLEQRNGIDTTRVAEIFAFFEHRQHLSTWQG